MTGLLCLLPPCQQHGAIQSPPFYFPKGRVPHSIRSFMESTSALSPQGGPHICTCGVPASFFSLGFTSLSEDPSLEHCRRGNTQSLRSQYLLIACDVFSMHYGLSSEDACCNRCFTATVDTLLVKLDQVLCSLETTISTH